MIPASEIHSCLANNVLRLILMPTEACNFRCTYCYEDFEIGRMDAAVVQGVQRYLSRRAAELELLTISWFGGEPLMARDIVTDIMSHARALATVHPSLRVVSDITTNGFLLTPRAVASLLDLGVGTYQVSLDGPRDAHDRTRVRAGGGPTFARIWQNLLAMRDIGRDFTVVVRLHVHAANTGQLPEFLDTFAKCFGGDRRFRLLFKEVAALGGPCDAEFPFLAESEREATLARLRQHARALTIDLVEADAPGVCYAARGNAFVVRADGRLNKCTVALGMAANVVGRIHADGRVELSGAKMLPWMRGLWSGNVAELECPMEGLASPAPSGLALRLGSSPGKSL